MLPRAKIEPLHGATPGAPPFLRLRKSEGLRLNGKSRKKRKRLGRVLGDPLGISCLFSSFLCGHVVISNITYNRRFRWQTNIHTRPVVQVAFLQP